MPTDGDLVRELRARAQVGAPAMSLDAAAVRAAGHRRLVRRRMVTGAGIAAAFAAAALVVAFPGWFTSIDGRGSAIGGDSHGVAMPSLQFRPVTSSSDGPCTEPVLTSDVPGIACNASGNSTYVVGASLGAVTPTSASLSDGQTSEQVVVTFGQAARATIEAITSDAVGQQLAILVHGRVISTQFVGEPISSGQLVLAGNTHTEAARIVDEILGSDAAPSDSRS